MYTEYFAIVYFTMLREFLTTPRRTAIFAMNFDPNQ